MTREVIDVEAKGPNGVTNYCTVTIIGDSNGLSIESVFAGPWPVQFASPLWMNAVHAAHEKRKAQL